MKKLAVLLALCLCVSAIAQRPALNSPVIKFTDSNGKPLAGGFLYSYAAGTTTPLATYTDSTSGSLNHNPVPLDSTGSATVFLGTNVYKFVLENSANVVQWTADNITQTSGMAGGRVYVDQFCTTPGTYDQSCLANAVAIYGSNTDYVMPAHTYSYTSGNSFNGLSNFIIEGEGAGTVLTGNGIQLISCTSCAYGTIRNLNPVSSIVPTVVTKAGLPSAAPYVVIDRFSTGTGYVPTINDQDIVPVASGGTCTSNCLTNAQSTETFPVQVFFNTSNNIEVAGLTGRYYSIVVYDSSNVDVHDNQILGGGSFGGVAFWKVSTGNHQVVVHSNIVSYSAYSGITLGGGDHFVVDGNTLSYNGESGFKTYQNSPQQNSYVTVTGNTSSFNWYDGFDLTSTNPRTSAFVANSTASGNTSNSNNETGYIGDGQGWTFTGNVALNNQVTGADLDFCGSTVSGNVIIGNNAASGAFNQLVVASSVTCPTGDVIANNVTDVKTFGNFGLYVDGATGNTVTGNLEETGADIIASNNLTRANSAPTGTYFDTQMNFGASGYNMFSSGTIHVVPQSLSGFWTVTVPAANVSLAGISPTANAGHCAEFLSAYVIEDAGSTCGGVANAISSATGGTGTGTVTCLTATCTNLSGTYSIAGGTFTTGNLLALVWPTTTTAYNCWAHMNGGTGFLGIGHSVATATGMNITNAVSVATITVTVDYGCSPK